MKDKRIHYITCRLMVTMAE